MKIILGLGNPGKKYEKTRHNIGWMALDAFLEKCHGGISCETAPDAWREQKKFGSLTVEIKIHDEKLVLAKPLTFMNGSGRAAKKLVDFYKINTADLWVIHDDLDIVPGKIKISFGASSAGHKGVSSIIESLGTNEFLRFRLGIGRSETIPSESYVLQPFGKQEKNLAKDAIKKTNEALLTTLVSGYARAMAEYN